MLDLLNRSRADADLTPLVEHPALVASATAHSRDMAACGRMSHLGSDGSSPFERMTAAGYRWEGAGECVACGTEDEARVAAMWLADPPHRAIILNHSHRHAGVAGVDGWWTADFASGMPDPPGRTETDPW